MLHDFRLRFVRFSLRLSLLLLALSAALVATIGSPEPLKQAVADSAIYTAAAGILSDQPSIKEVPTVRPAIQDAVNDTLPPAKIQAMSDQFIDGTYNWLEGETDKPDFRIDLTPIVSRFTTVIGDTAVQQAQALPVCSPEQVQQFPVEKIKGTDLLSFGCLPPGLTPETVRQQTMEQLAASNRLIKDPILTADTVPTNPQGQTFFQTASSAPTLYRFISILPWLLVSLALLCAGLIVRMNRTITNGIYDVAVSAFWIGIVIIVISGVSHALFTIMTQPGGSITQSAAGSFQQYIVAFARSLEYIWFKGLLVFGIAYSLVGGLTIVGIRLRASANQPDYRPESGMTHAPEQGVTTADTTETPAPATPSAPSIEQVPAPRLASPGSTIRPKDDQ